MTLVIMPALLILLLSCYPRRQRRGLFFNTKRRLSLFDCWLRIKHANRFSRCFWIISCDVTMFPVPQTKVTGGFLPWSVSSWFLDIAIMNIIISDIVYAMVSLIHPMEEQTGQFQTIAPWGGNWINWKKNESVADIVMPWMIISYMAWCVPKLFAC